MNNEVIELGINDADECLRMRESIFEELRKNKEIELYLADETDDEFRKFFNDCDSYAVGVRDSNEDRLVACAIASFREEPLKRFRGLIPDACQNDSDVAYFELAQVAPPARGSGLQCKMERELEKWAKKRGARYFTAIVSPKNKHSLDNLTKLGFLVVGEFVHKETGFSRLLVCKKFSE